MEVLLSIPFEEISVDMCVDVSNPSCIIGEDIFGPLDTLWDRRLLKMIINLLYQRIINVVVLFYNKGTWSAKTRLPILICHNVCFSQIIYTYTTNKIPWITNISNLTWILSFIGMLSIREYFLQFILMYSCLLGLYCDTFIIICVFFNLIVVEYVI